MIKADCHLHTNHSGDGHETMENMIKKAIELGLDTICFTEHNDFNYPVSDECPKGILDLNVDSYLYELISLREKYAGQIRVLYGVELGLTPEAFRENAVFIKNNEFDFVIGSTHIVHGKDPYYPPFYEGRSDKEAYMEYFEAAYENVKKYSNFDVFGHLDYTVRYGKNKDKEYSYKEFADITDEILKVLKDKEMGLELNTSGLRHGLKDFNPCREILIRYRQLGGEIITVGSDAHYLKDMAIDYNIANEVLKDCGFKYYTVYEKRIPEFIRL